ncbi:MAG TPA: HD domain-containing phosphohydrolase, partial [Microvirga sp.]|nr:HD domain-containing phosphohydrolase [Microvirga sp.]
SELVGALSHALDLTEGQPQGHSLRCCWIGMAMADVAGFTPDQCADLYYTLLLKDLGCSSNAARICSLYLADDLSFKHDFKRVGSSLPQALRFVLQHTGVGAGLAERILATMRILKNGGEIARELIETRCERGATIAQKMRFSAGVQAGIRDLDEHWDGGGKPAGLAGEAISPSARIALIAQVADVFCNASGPGAALSEISTRSGTWFDPALAEAFARAADAFDFWSTLSAPDLNVKVAALEPSHRIVLVDGDYLDEVAAGFAEVVDAKSPYTHGHSERVALYTDLIARELGFDEARRRWLKRAALLHDVGKLGVSNRILDKPGKLDDAEWASMRQHSALSQAILGRVGALGDVAVVAGSHHERLDGRGYPYGLSERDIPLETRVITVADVFDALTAERPYRAAMPAERAFAIMEQDAGAAFDPECLAALRRAMARLNES